MDNSRCKFLRHRYNLRFTDAGMSKIIKTLAIDSQKIGSPTDPNRIWDVTLFRKENAFYIELTYEGLCKKEAIAD